MPRHVLTPQGDFRPLLTGHSSHPAMPPSRRVKADGPHWIVSEKRGRKPSPEGSGPRVTHRTPRAALGRNAPTPYTRRLEAGRADAPAKKSPTKTSPKRSAASSPSIHATSNSPHVSPHSSARTPPQSGAAPSHAPSASPSSSAPRPPPSHGCAIGPPPTTTCAFPARKAPAARSAACSPPSPDAFQSYRQGSHRRRTLPPSKSHPLNQLTRQQ